MPTSDDLSNITGTFGPNLWLVEEMYQLFLDDPSAVDASWVRSRTEFGEGSSVERPLAPPAS